MFIELNTIGGRLALVNVNTIATVVSEGNGTKLQYIDNEFDCFKESYAQVLLVIRTAMKQKYGRKPPCTKDS